MERNETIQQALPHIMCVPQESLSHYTFTRTGGPAEWLVLPKTIEEVCEVVRWTRRTDTPLTVLGNASNVIVRDGGITGVVLLLQELNQVTVSQNRITAQAGAKLIAVSALARDHQLTGLEFACGIPGSIGGAVFMNAGAYGGEVKDVIESVLVVTADGEQQEVPHAALDFSYRHSAIQENGAIVVATTFRLQEGDSVAITEQMTHLTYLRESKQPLEYPSCGSVFKRPEGYFAGKLIQDAGLQGMRCGGVEVSQKHAGFMVNIDNGTATDYVQLIALVQERVRQQFGVSLETEVRIIGENQKEGSQ